MANRFQNRSASAANWTSTNPILAQGEWGLETDTIRLKMGDGVTAWNDLLYWHGKGQVITINTTGGTTTLTQAQGMGSYLRITGILTSDAIIVVNDNMEFTGSNETTGAYTVTFKIASQIGGTVVAQGTRQSLVADGIDCEPSTTAGAGSGDVTGPASSVDSEIAIYSGTGGKTIKRYSGTGLVKTSAGVTSQAILNTDYLSPLSTPENIQMIGNVGNLYSYLTDTGSAGWVEGGTINDVGSGNITVDAGEVVIRETISATGLLQYVTFPALTSTAIPSNSTRYVVVNYNAGSPIIQVSSTDTSNGFTILYLGEVHNVGGVLAIHNDHRPAGDLGNRQLYAWSSLLGTKVISGETVTDPASPSRKVAVSAGSIVDRFLRPVTTAAVDTNGAGTFVGVYRDGAGGWTYEATQTQWENTKIDTNTGTLVAMTVAYYANRWVIRGLNGDIAIQYGQAEYATLAAAQAEASPATRPEEYAEHGYYVAQITFQKSGASPASIASIKPIVGGTTNIAGGATTHNDLGGLQGGSAGQYYHATLAEYTVLQNTSGTNSGNETTTTVGALINGATAKTTPVDADYIGLMDSAASNILKKLSWANVKATLIATAMTWTGVQTFNDGKLALRNVADTFSGVFTNTITAARTWTLPDISSTIAVLGLAQIWTKTQSPNTTTLTSSAGSIAIDLSLGNHYTHTLTENTTLAAPSNVPVVGTSFSITFIQHASAAKTLAFNTAWKPVTGTAGVLSTTVGTENTMTCTVKSDGTIGYGFATYGIA